MEAMTQPMFAKFVIGDLFGRVKTKKLKKDFDKRRDTRTEWSKEFCVPLVNAKLGDNGVMFYGRKKDWQTQEMCIDIIQNGAVATGKVYAQPEPTAVLWDAHLIKPKADVDSVEVLLYLATAIEKSIRGQFSRDDKAYWDKVKLCGITLPVIPSTDPDRAYTPDSIDWVYMERYIAELEQERIAELDTYLKAAGLDDCELTPTDEAALVKQPVFAEFKAFELFNIEKGKRLTKADMLPGNTLFISASAKNNGITAKIGNTECLHPANTFTVSYNGSVGEVFLQDEPFWASDDVNVWYPKFEFSKERMLYIMTVVKKLGRKHNYSAKWSIDEMKNEILSLPVTPSTDPHHAYTPDDIDWAYMDHYIYAVEKLVMDNITSNLSKI